MRLNTCVIININVMSIKKPVPNLLLLAAYLFFLVLPIASVLTGRVSADHAVEWVDAATIKIGDDNYIDNRVGDSMDYFLDGVDDCTSVIKGFNNDYNDNPNFASAELVVKTRHPETGSCQTAGGHDITISRTENARVWFHWVDGGRLQAVDGIQSSNFGRAAYIADEDDVFQNGIFQEAQGIENTFSPTEGDCRSSVVAESADTATFVVRYAGNCDPQEGERIQIRLGSTDNQSLEPGQGSPIDGGGNIEDDRSCEARGGVMSWILCPVILLMDSAISWMDTQIQALLEVDENKYNDNPQLKRAWSNIRNIAYILLIPTMLLMVIGTALGFEVFSAYTIKRALPRMVLATIFITFSWYVCVFLIQLTNVIGGGILGLMTGPFGASVGTLSIADLFEGGIVGSFISTGLFSIALVAILFLFLGPIALFVLAAFLVLLAREMFILALVMLGPIAILAWIFPGNDKPWKLWWSAFSKLLLMFPLIMVLIAVGRIFAYIIDSTRDGGFDDSILGPIMVLGAYILPYVLIPLTFKFAGGIFANLAGVVNDREKGLFDRMKQGRQHKYERAKSGNFFRGARAGSFRGRLNTGIEAGANIRRAGFDPRHMKTRMGTSLNNAAFDEAMEALDKNAALQAIKGNEDYLEAGKIGMYRYKDAAGNVVDAYNDGSDGAMREFFQRRGYQGQDVENGVSMVREARRSMSAQAYNIAATVATSGTGTGYATGIGELYRSINETAGDDRGLAARMLATSRGIAERSRRPDLVASGFGTSLNAMNDLHAGEVRSDYQDKTTGQTIVAGTAVSLDDITARQDRETLRTMDPRTIISAKPKMIERLVPAMNVEIDAAYATGDRETVDRTLAKYAAIYDQMAATSPESAQIMAQGVLGRTITAAEPLGGGASGPVVPTSETFRQRVEKARARPPEPDGHQTFLDHRREYGSRFAADQAAALNTPPPEEP